MKLLWQILYAVGLIFIAVYEQILKNNVDIWSHCMSPSSSLLCSYNSSESAFSSFNNTTMQKPRFCPKASFAVKLFDNLLIYN